MVHSIFSLRSLFYLAYAFILTAVLLYVRFPTEKFRVFCEKRIEQFFPGSECNIDHIGYRFPLSASFANVQISKGTDEERSGVHVSLINVSPEVKKFWRVINLSGEMYSGLFEAKLDLDLQEDTFQVSGIELKGLDAGQLAQSFKLDDRELSGNIDYSGEYQGVLNDPAGGDGIGTLQVGAGSLELLQPILALSVIEFESISVEVTHGDGKLRLTEGKLNSKELKTDFSGGVRLVSPLLNSNLLLTGQLDPQVDFLNRHPQAQIFAQRLMQRYKMKVLPFKVGGTIKRPLFRFST